LNGYFLNTTDGYHKNELDSLGWEVTLSVMLEDERSPCRRVIKKPDSFGNLLYDFLSIVFPMEGIRRVIEIGGGYGYLMRDFLQRNETLRATMVDISPFLLSAQTKTLQGFDVQFKEEDFLEMEAEALSGFDLAVLNEVVGDLPTACNVPKRLMGEGMDPKDMVLHEIQRLCNSYGIMPAGGERFTANLGAIQATEKLCSAQIPYIYISEHSCQARVPAELAKLIELDPTGDPERIRLRGHDEYTIRFSDLEKVAISFGYATRRGQYLDFIEPVIEGEVPFILCLNSSKVDRYEIIRQFIEDLVKYEYLVLCLRDRAFDLRQRSSTAD
jgi:hypothetical protein